MKVIHRLFVPSTRRPMGAAAILGVVASHATFAAASTTTFDHGNEGWGVFFDNDGVLGDFLESDGGAPGAHLRWRMVDTFGCTLRNDANEDVIGDYGRWSSPVELGIDVQVGEISFFGSPVARNLIVELVDYHDPDADYPWSSVWFNLGEMSADQTADWTRFSIVIDDPVTGSLPPGWGGAGAEDPNTFEPTLPPGRTFASVLANVEEIRFTTFEPGYFYGFTNFELRFDNPTVSALAAPILGDMNCDGVFNNFDIDPFVLALVDPPTYELTYPECSILRGDINGDGEFNNFDIDPFVACVLNLGCP
ncbi:MAG: PEP-CTERM sorting domain-containing protein [Planctomycetia bacterium]|nr:MAG: PEP-CTERM sorting domain-containing protein [Planctomycetia bacterium]